MIIYGSSDATLNPAGVRIGTAEIYAQIEQIPEVVEAICIGQDWEHDVRVVLFVPLIEGGSGKITEIAVRDVVHGRPVKNTEALANSEALALYVDVTELRSDRRSLR